jgi:hypothetical protein
MAGRVYAMDAFVQSVGAEHARGGSIEVPSAIAKVFTSESSFAVCDRAIQMHGALGFLESTGVARMLRDCRITRIFEGANDVLLLRIGAARLASREPIAPVVAANDLGALAQRFEASVAAIRARLGVAAMRRQLILQRIAQAEIALRVGLVASQNDDPLGRHAAIALVEEGEQALDALARAEKDETAAEAIAKSLQR